jgi:beta-glucosidase
VESAALAISRGCDLDCGDVYKQLGQAVERGLLTEADIDRSLARTLRTRFKLGLFDPPEVVPYSHIPASVVGSPAHRKLAREAATKSIVLLKNEGGLLPVPAAARTLFVVGPTAANLDVLLGNYYGLNDQMTTFIEGIVGAAPEGMRINYLPGCQLVHPNLNPQDWAFGEARAADLTIACMGMNAQMEGEEGSAILSAQNGDRERLTLPDVQVEYIKQLAQRTQRLVLVLSGGSPIELGELEALAQAIVMVWYPGQAGGEALADLLFGRTVPSGRLPITFPRSVDDLPPYADYAMDRRTYRYATAEPLFPFGFGLSYTRFAYSDLRLNTARLKAGRPLRVTVQVTNQGDRDAEEVVQVYLSDREASVTVPRQRLAAFRRVRLKAGQSKRVSFTLSPALLSLVDEDGRTRLEPGLFEVAVGGCSLGARGQALGAPAPVTAAFEVLA